MRDDNNYFFAALPISDGGIGVHAYARAPSNAQSAAGACMMMIDDYVSMLYLYNVDLQYVHALMHYMFYALDLESGAELPRAHRDRGASTYT